MPTMMKVLESQLEKKKYLVGEEFSLADLNVASVVGLCSEIKFGLLEYENIKAWLGRISTLSSYQRYLKLCS